MDRSSSKILAQTGGKKLRKSVLNLQDRELERSALHHRSGTVTALRFDTLSHFSRLAVWDVNRPAAFGVFVGWRKEGNIHILCFGMFLLFFVFK